MQRFHNQRTLKLLQEFVLDVGVLAYRELARAFPEVEHLGFSLSDIMQADTVVIRRKPKKEENKQVEQPSAIGEGLPEVEQVDYNCFPLLSPEDFTLAEGRNSGEEENLAQSIDQELL